MDRIDFKKDFKELYGTGQTPALVNVPRFKFLMIDGKGAPASKIFQDAVQVLYGITFTIKFDLKKEGVIPEYSVPPLEGLWWMANGKPFDLEAKAQWRWTLMIAQPAHIKDINVIRAIKTLRSKKQNPAIEHVRFSAFEEGRCAQILHIGPYAEEAPTIALLHEFARQHHYKLHGKHHEIYLGDPRRAKPEKLRTILRHPVSV